MAVTFPDPGKNRRWSVEKTKYRLDYWSSATNPRLPYTVSLEELVPEHVEFYREHEWVIPAWYRRARRELVTKQKTVPEAWKVVKSETVDDLETDTLLKAAEVILERVAKSDWEKSRLGTYPPLVLEK